MLIVSGPIFLYVPLISTRLGQQQHVGCRHGWLMKSEEPQLKSEEGHQNDLKHNTHDVMHVWACWMHVMHVVVVGCSTM